MTLLYVSRKLRCFGYSLLSQQADAMVGMAPDDTRRWEDQKDGAGGCDTVVGRVTTTSSREGEGLEKVGPYCL